MKRASNLDNCIPFSNKLNSNLFKLSSRILYRLKFYEFRRSHLMELKYLMEINVLKGSKDEIEMQLENLTIVELLRVYLNKDSAVTFAAWKREHPTEKPIISIKTKGKTVKKAVSDAVEAITKDLDKIEKDFKGMK